MSTQEPTPEEWRRLYEAAVAFRDLAPWRWMTDSDIFGVRDPDGREIGYCCVLGMAGEVFGMVLYRGIRGLKGYLDTVQGWIRSPMDFILSQDCIRATFEDRTDLDRRDLELIRRLGLRFRGRKMWPQFRSFIPGYAPWYLAGHEVRFLTVALEQAVVVAEKFKEDPEVLPPPEEGKFLVRVPVRRGGKVYWRSRRMEPDEGDRYRMFHVEFPVVEGLDVASGKVWEVGYFAMPTPIQEERGKRPFYPCVFMCVDRDSGFVLGAHVTSYDDLVEEGIRWFAEMLADLGWGPEEVRVSQVDVEGMFSPVAEVYGIPVRKVRVLRAWSSARKSMERFGWERR